MFEQSSSLVAIIPRTDIEKKNDNIWMVENETNEEARILIDVEFPSQFNYNGDDKIWTTRKKCKNRKS